MKPYKIAMLGTENAVHSHIQAVCSVGGRAQLVAAVDIDAQRVQAVCAQYDIPFWYTDTAVILADVQPDLVHVVTPPARNMQKFRSQVYQLMKTRI